MLPNNAEIVVSIIVGMSTGIAYSKAYTLNEMLEELDFYGILRILMVMSWIYFLLIPILLVLFWNGW